MWVHNIKDGNANLKNIEALSCSKHSRYNKCIQHFSQGMEGKKTIETVVVE